MRNTLQATARGFVLIVCMISVCMISQAIAADVPSESDYYKIVTAEIPQGVVLEACAFQMMPDGRLAVASRRGEIWMIADPFSKEIRASQFTRFAHGLHEVLSLAERNGWLYVVQRCDVSRLKDTNNDGKADLYEVVSDAWGISGDQHEYAFGSKFDRNGDLWITLCLTGSFTSKADYRGWCVRVNENGKLVPTASGIRSPGGMGFNATGDVFYTDNQGPWNGTCTLRLLRPGKFAGHPGGLDWYSKAESTLGKAPQMPQSGGRMVAEADRIPELELPAVYFPYKKMGQSASGITCDLSGGKFGPFEKQLFVADQTYSQIMRVDLEQIDGVYQGACFPFREGFGSGLVGLESSEKGPIFAGGTARGWGSRGKLEFSVERLDWTGKTPFEIQTMRLNSDGFTLTMTEPVDVTTATSKDSYSLGTYTYIYQSAYGSPEVDQTTPVIESISVDDDAKTIRLVVKGLQRGHVHELHLNGVRSQKQMPLLHPVAYYTLNRFKQPEGTGQRAAK